jgi:hypothetical protein
MKGKFGTLITLDLPEASLPIELCDDSCAAAAHD